MKKSEAIFGLIRIPLDALAVFAALLLSYRLREANMDLVPGWQFLEPARTLPPLPDYLSQFIWPSIMLFIVLAAALSLYTLRSTLGAWREMGRVGIAAVLWVIVVIAWYFLVLKQLFFSRILLLHSVTFVFLFVTVIRLALVFVQRAMLRLGTGRLLVVSLGRHPLAAHAKTTLLHDEHYYYLGHLANVEALRKLQRQRPLDLVIQTDPNPGSEETLALIRECRSQHVGYGFLPPVLAEVPHLLRVERLGLLPLIRLQPTPLDGWGRVVKRCFDIVVSALLLLVLSPLFLVVSLGILLDSGWPIFYVSRRVGDQGRKKLRVLKFRSMIRDADAQKEKLLQKNARKDGPLFKIKDDPRVTRFGKFLRRWTIDELPQLLNVFVGQMSLVGPRPHLPQEVERYSAEQRRVFAVKPGMTGLAQVSGRSNLTFDDEVRLDLQYIEEWSIFLDLSILLRTAFVVLSREGAD